MTVLDSRKAKGMIDKVGKEVAPVKNSLSKYERGKKTLGILAGQQERAKRKHVMQHLVL